jgi:hypothetical protein
MALDFVVLGENGEPEMTASVGVEAHARLVRLVDELALTHLARLRDYYGDVEFTEAELGPLFADVAAASQAATSDAEVAGFLEALRDVIALAAGRRAPVLAVAD